MKDYTPEEMEQIRYKLNGESPMDRIKRKSREEPFVPAGIRDERLSETQLP